MLRPTLRTEVQARLGETTADFWPTADIDRALDEAMRRFANEEKWPWLYTSKTGVSTVAHQSWLDLEQDVELQRHFNLLLTATGDARPRTLKRVTPPEGFALRTEFYTENEPRWYYAEAGKQTGGPPVTGYKHRIHLVPTPDVVYTLEYQYIRNPAALADDTEPDCPVAYQEAIISWATGLLWLKELNGGGKAQEQFNIYQAVVEQARREMKRTAPDAPLTWGGQEPQVRVQTLEDYVLARIGVLG